MENLEIKELSQTEKFNSRLQICCDTYVNKTNELSVLTVKAARHFGNIYKNHKVMGKLSDKQSDTVLYVIEQYKANRESYEALNVPNETVNVKIETYIDNFSTKAESLLNEILGVLVELWMLTKVVDIIDDDVQEFIDLAFDIPKYKEFKEVLENIDIASLNVIKQVYLTDPKLSLTLLRDKIKEVEGVKEVKEKVKEIVVKTEKVVNEDILSFTENIDINNDDDEDDEDDDEKSSSSSKSFLDIKLSNTAKIGVGIVGLLALGYVAKKTYDHFHSDDVVIIDSDGLDFSSSFDNVMSSFDDISSSFDGITCDW